MAFTNFYVQTTGNDMNAGTTTADAADVTQTNGSWDITADTFIAAAGTPFSGVTANVDYASVYLDGTTSGAVYVSLVTAVGGAGANVTLSTTTKWGTKPTALASGRSCKINGAWASELPFASGGLGATTVPTSTKINIKAATYTVTATRSFTMVGTTTAPLWYSGYNTTIGDLDNDTANTLAKPTFALNATFAWEPQGAHTIWSSLTFTGNTNGNLYDIKNVVHTRHIRIRVTNSSAGINASGITVRNSATLLAYCYAKAPTTATGDGLGPYSLNTAATFIGCVGEGGGAGTWAAVNTSPTLIDCIALNPGASGVQLTTGAPIIVNLTVYNATTDGVRWTGTPIGLCAIIGSLFSNCGGYGINNASGTNTNLVVRACNDFFSVASGSENGFGDSPASFGQTDSSAVVTSSTDMTPVAGSNARNNGFPGVYEAQTFTHYLDIGAVDHIDPAAGGGGAVAIFGA